MHQSLAAGDGSGAIRVAQSEATTPIRDELVIEHVDLVKAVANRLARRLPSSVETVDLTSVGMLGLIDAAGRYRPSLGVPFDAFASKRVLGAMLDELRSLDRAPRSLRHFGREVEPALGRLRSELKREPTEAETATAVGMSEDEYWKATEQLRGAELRMRELDRADDQGEPLIALRVSDDERPDVQLERSQMRQVLAHALGCLPERERTVVSLYYEQELTLKEIGKVIGVSESRVCQLRTLAVSRVRVIMRETLGENE